MEFVAVSLQHLAGQEHDGDFAHSESWSGPDPDLDPNNRQHQRRGDADLDALHRKHHQNRFYGKGEKAKGANGIIFCYSCYYY